MAKKRFFWSITLSFFDLEKIFIPANPPKQAKILGVFKLKFFSKIDINHFLAATKYTKKFEIYANLSMSENN